MKTLSLLSLLGAFAAAVVPAGACDLCGCYTPQIETTMASPSDQPIGFPGWASGLYGAVAEQFTYFNTAQIDGREVAEPDRSAPRQLDHATGRGL